MRIIVKRQPVHRPSMQNPHTIAAIFIFDVIAEKVHTTSHTVAFKDGGQNGVSRQYVAANSSK